MIAPLFSEIMHSTGLHGRKIGDAKIFKYWFTGDIFFVAGGADCFGGLFAVVAWGVVSVVSVGDGGCADCGVGEVGLIQAAGVRDSGGEADEWRARLACGGDDGGNNSCGLFFNTKCTTTADDRSGAAISQNSISETAGMVLADDDSDVAVELAVRGVLLACVPDGGAGRQGEEHVGDLRYRRRNVRLASSVRTAGPV